MNQIIADVGVFETRAAVVQNGRMMEMHVERRDQLSLVNNIYLGQIVNRLPGMQTIFVDAGLDKNIFVYHEDLIKPFNDLREGQLILLQVAKDAIGEKGPKGTMRIAIPGRYLVMMPFEHHIGLSTKIKNETERQRLQRWAEKTVVENQGMIIRTAALDQSDEVLSNDWSHLLEVWHHVLSQSNQKVKKLVYREQSLLTRLLRDVTSEPATRILINHPEEAKQLQSICESMQPGRAPAIEETAADASPFSDTNLELEWQRLMSPDVQLSNGGTLVINATEALTVIDVNSGRYTGGSSFEETALQVNLVAALEIAHQLRVRDIGGIILIDFIDMKKEINQRRVMEALGDALAPDRQKCVLMGMTRLGLVEMTRKKSRQKLETFYQTTCPCCHGTGVVESVHWLIYELEKAFRRYRGHPEIKEAIVMMHPERYEQIIREKLDLTVLAKTYDLNLNLTLSKSIDFDRYTLSFR